MKKLLLVLISFIISVSIPYVGCSFIEWTYNPKEWSIASRIISFFVSYAIFVISLKDLERYEK